ncbi:MAG TPA: sensor histidine kinase [Symbiobacteriaceae bacterium]|nr:sensor histidine kinase [Symbiobacteriaceae bacterium]
MRKWLKKELFLSVRTHIALLATGIVFLAGAAGTVVVGAYTLNSVEEQLGRRVLHVARTVAEIDDVKRSVGRPGGDRVIQPIAERIRQVNNVEYVVVLDMNRRRYSHPVPDRIGTVFTGGDEGPAFAEHTYVSRAAGMWGNSVRAFVPVMSEDFTEQTGVVVVGILTPSVFSVLTDLAPQLSVALMAALSVGLVGAWLLGSRIKRQLLGLEPPEIARLLQEREAILNAIGEGVLAIDREQRITVLSEEARRIVGRGADATGMPVTDLVPHSRLPEILRTGEPEFDQEMLLGTTVVMTNRVPVRIQGRIIGAVATFRDRTEVHRLADQLTGVTKFIDSLRAQNHEHMNRLHTIAGLIQFGRHQQAIDYIYSSYEEQQEQTTFLTRRFQDYRVAALLLGKLHRARELGIKFTIDSKSRLRTLPRKTDASSLVVMVGNLLENAMDAVGEVPADRRQVDCLIRDGDHGLRIVVRDSGHGIPPAARQDVWRPGFSTKSGQHQGIGLALVRQHVESAGGSISFVTDAEGTAFEIWIPHDENTAEGAEPV